MTKVWLDAGFESEQVDMPARKLMFRRVRKPQAVAAAQSAGEKPFHPLYGAMKGLIRIMPGTDLTQPADPEWADRLDAQYGPEKKEATKCSRCFWIPVRSSVLPKGLACRGGAQSDASD